MQISYISSPRKFLLVYFKYLIARPFLVVFFDNSLSVCYNQLVDVFKSFFGGVRKEGDYTILQSFSACDFDGVELPNEPVMDSQTHKRIRLCREDAVEQSKNYPNGRAVPFRPYRKEKGPSCQFFLREV